MPYKLGGVIWNEDGSLYNESKTATKYFLVFAKQGENLGAFSFATGDEAVARQFCEDFPSYYYISRDMVVDHCDSDDENSEEDSPRKRETDTWMDFIND